MSGNTIPGFTDSERWIVASALKERYGCMFFYRVQADQSSSGEGKDAPY